MQERCLNMSSERMKMCPEWDYVVDRLELEKRVQRIYDNTKRFAQKHEWDKHIPSAVSMIPMLHYLNYDDDYNDAISRILGRIAWSMIRLEEYDRANDMLEYSEKYDEWQAAANYYWGSEYSHRSRNDNYARDYLKRFRTLAKSSLKINGETDLELAVNFYEMLIKRERNSKFFKKSNKSNMSDLARFYELKARLNQDSFGYRRAAFAYRRSKLYSYAWCCEAFAHLIKAQKQLNMRLKKVELEKAKEALVGKHIFEDEYIQKLLIKFICVRIDLCNIMIVMDENKPKRMLEIEYKYRQIDNEILGKEKHSSTLSDLSTDVPFFSDCTEWEMVQRYVESYSNVSICPDNIRFYKELDKLLDRAQTKLPSYSFLIL